MTTRGAATIALTAFVSGLVVLFGAGLPRLRDGSAVWGSVITACGAVASVLGLAALIILARQRQQGRSGRGTPGRSP